MFNPGQIQRNYQQTVPVIRNSTHLVLDNIQNNNRSKWDEPIQIPPILYTKFSIPIPTPPKQLKSYPKSLLDYIKRSYEKCKDDNQKNSMEKTLRQIVKNFENDFNQINWQSYPLPNLQQDNLDSKNFNIKSQQKSGSLMARSKLNQIKLLSCYNIVQQQKPSKAMEIAKKRSEKLEQKLNRTNKETDDEKKKQVFIGFSSVPPLQIKQIPRFQFAPPHAPPITQQSVQSVPSKSLSSLNNSHEIKNLKNFQVPMILECQNTQKTLQTKLQKEKEKQKDKDKQRKHKHQKQREKQRQKEKKEKNKQKQKQKVSQKFENVVQRKPKIILSDKPKQSTRKTTQKQLQLISKLKQNNEQLNHVARRFNDFNKLKSDNYQKDAIEIDDEVDFDQVIVGKSQSIEKPYLRITGRPNPDTVRPEPILKKALIYLLDKYSKHKNYEYLISQLRSIRQDLTVQHIKNGFTIQVYEENLEISLCEKDIPQFKHCQTTLWQLYCQGHFYTKESRDKFIAHQMLTLIMEDKNQQMEFMLTKIPEGSLENAQIQQCLKLKQKLILGNYRAFFDFYANQNKFIKCLLDLYIDKMYVKFLLMICRTCGEKVLIKSLAQTLGQNEQKIEGIIKIQGGIVQNGYLMLKQSYSQFLKSEHLVTKKVTILLG